MVIICCVDWTKDYFDESYSKLFLEEQSKERTLNQVNFIIKTLGLDSQTYVCDACCGLGRHSIELARQGIKVFGFDFNENYIQQAKDSALTEKLDNVMFESFDVRDFNETSKFDAVLSLWVSFGYFDDNTNADVFKRMTNALKPNGSLLVDIENREYILKHFIHEKWRVKGDVVLLERFKMNLETSRLKCNRMLIHDNERKEYQRFIRMYTATEILNLAKDSGLVETRLFGDWDGSHYDVNTPRMILIGKKKP